jgi:cytochrome c biogenesis protein ResB
MTDERNISPDPDKESYPIQPHYHPINRIARNIYDFLASARLAILLLISILVCCVIGVTFFRGPRSVELIFGSLWFNGLLVLLVLNVACCFFGRIWGRKVTIVSFGMILFHLSFVVMFAGIVFNSLFKFNGTLRLTEGETLSSSDPKSYDVVQHGRFFDFARLKGETTLVRMHRGYKVEGKDKVLAYELSVADGAESTSGVLYITKKFSYKGIDYFRDREGYSLLTLLHNRQGKEMYGVHLPLQSIKKQDNSMLYTTGTKSGPGRMQFPPENNLKLFDMQLTYIPDKQMERSGSVRYQIWPLSEPGKPHEKTMLADGTKKIGERFAFGDYELSSPEVRYWVAMNVLYEPGKPLVLASLCAGLTGMIITTVGRMRRRKR